MNTPLSQVMHQAANGNLKYNVTPVVPFVMCLSGLCWALQLNLSMRTAGKNNIVLQAGWQISAKQSPNTITSGHLGPVSTEPFFFFFSCLHQSFFLPYGMPSSILYFLSLLMLAFIHFIAPLPPHMQERVLFPLSFTISSTLHRHICNIVCIVFLPQYVVTFASSNFLPSFLQFYHCWTVLQLSF